MRGIHTSTSLAIDQAESAVRQALSSQGFGVLTEIDVAGVLREKLGVERAPLRILGACNPNLAHRALDANPATALVLPCNVVLESDGDTTTVTAVDPRDLLDDPALADLADEAATRLQHALDQLPPP